MPRTPIFRLDIDAPADWAPLEQLARLCSERPDLPELDPDQFMCMGRAVSRGLPPVLLYKHVCTRRYLNLDHLVHAFCVTPVATPRVHQFDDVRLTCRSFRDVASALAWVARADDLLALG
jgi:hypothetical protein